MIRFTCPLSLVLPLPTPPHHRLDLLQLPTPPPPTSSLPWDRLSSTLQGLAWITGMPGQVSLPRKVSSVFLSEADDDHDA